MSKQHTDVKILKNSASEHMEVTKAVDGPGFALWSLNPDEVVATSADPRALVRYARMIGSSSIRHCYDLSAWPT